MQNAIGNRTEEAVNNFIKELDSNKHLGPKPIDGVGFTINSISDTIGCTEAIARELFRRPSPFLYDEQDQVYVISVNENTGEEIKVYITSTLEKESQQNLCREIENFLPTVTFDLECGGYPSRQSEAAALYKVLVINALQEQQYEAEISRILSNYDFNRWCSGSEKYEFTALLNKVQEEADTVSRIVLSCANTKLISEKVKKGTSYKGIIKEEDAEKLRILAEEDAIINISFNKKYERATSVKEKILIGEELAERRKKMLSDPKVPNDIYILFSIYNLNQNAIPGRAKRIIRNAASMYVSNLVEEKVFKNQESASEFQKKLVSRAQKLYLSRMKEIRYKLWNDRTVDTDLSLLIPKY